MIRRNQERITIMTIKLKKLHQMKKAHLIITDTINLNKKSSLKSLIIVILIIVLHFQHYPQITNK